MTELVEFMFENQFAMARSAAGAKPPPIYVYAVETAIQMTLTELNENLREIYIEAYTQKEASEFIFRETAKELYQIFGPYQPELTARDFYDMEIGSASIMRGYMAHPCDEELTLEKKLRLFLTMSLRAVSYTHLAKGVLPSAMPLLLRVPAPMGVHSAPSRSTSAPGATYLPS